MWRQVLSLRLIKASFFFLRIHSRACVGALNASRSAVIASASASSLEATVRGRRRGQRGVRGVVLKPAIGNLKGRREIHLNRLNPGSIATACYRSGGLGMGRSRAMSSECGR